jgi:hypothetical protein
MPDYLESEVVVIGCAYFRLVKSFFGEEMLYMKTKLYKRR